MFSEANLICIWGFYLSALFYFFVLYVTSNSWAWAATSTPPEAVLRISTFLLWSLQGGEISHVKTPLHRQDHSSRAPLPELPQCSTVAHVLPICLLEWRRMENHSLLWYPQVTNWKRPVQSNTTTTRAVPEMSCNNEKSCCRNHRLNIPRLKYRETN